MDERLLHFRRTVEAIDDINDDSQKSFSAGINVVSVMTPSEIETHLLSVNLTVLHSERKKKKHSTSHKQESPPTSQGSPPLLMQASHEAPSLPKMVDWEARGALPPDVDQGKCGSCWAFGATGALEGAYWVVTGNQVDFSEQEILDCAPEYTEDYKKHNGCNGGLPHWGFDYVMTTGRLTSNKRMGYVGKDRKCNVKDAKNAFTDAIVTGYDDLHGGPDSDLLEMVSKGVVTVGIKCGDTDFMYYRTGIYECSGKCNCMKTPDHAVVLVGYAPNYWKIKNSWGSDWGEGGYIRMSRETPNMCNIMQMPTRPILECKGNSCNGWDFSNNEDWSKEEVEEAFEIGDIEKCGELQHLGGLCVDMQYSDPQYAVLTLIGCDREFCLTDRGYLQDTVTDMCLGVSGDAAEGAKVTFVKCSTAKRWSFTGNDLQLKGSKLCMHPRHESHLASNPVLELTDSCKSKNQMFEMKEPLCWEEEKGVKMKKGKFGGKILQEKSLDDAKDLCLETPGCTGVTKQKKYFLAKENKTTKSKKHHKVFVLRPCVEACEAGEERCDDGECRDWCEGDKKGECPAGTVRCGDGMCKHEHLC